MFFSLSSSTDQPMIKGYPILLWLFGSFLCIHHYYRSFQFARTWLPHNCGIRSGVQLFEVGLNIYHSRWAKLSSKKRSFWCFSTSLQFLCIHECAVSLRNTNRPFSTICQLILWCETAHIWAGLSHKYLFRDNHCFETKLAKFAWNQAFQFPYLSR